jgi:hypothetical protein
MSPVVPEEPHGILTAASVLNKSNLGVHIGEAHDEQGSPCGVYVWLKKNYLVGEEKCRLTNDGVVRVEHLLAKPRE